MMKRVQHWEEEKSFNRQGRDIFEKILFFQVSFRQK
jgi:hypothetical protein